MAADELTLWYAKKLIGAPYIWGGQSPGGFDCSGLVIEILMGAHILPHGYDATAQGLWNDFHDDWPSILHPLPGALVFYGRAIHDITHVGFAIDGYRMIEAGGGGSMMKTPQQAWDKGAFVRLRGIYSRKDFLTMIMPHYPLG